ncbi:hypothetical protein ACO22_06375 [Paracoccidioides brasiliensis]|uniref:Zinc finger C3HC4 RING-type domain-containing protein n=1 Tax=Paracoccidioides brasiliensis TaxID=121759 RepID=A0A1D2J7M6_PARBR|nr:hypothetical protein ACO22_06375 [Paracoccidioides brasiliensis]
MALTEPDLLRNQLRDAIIIDGSDAERSRTDYSYAVYEALFDSSAPSDVSETSQPPKKCKVPNLGTVLVELFSYKTGIRRVFEAEHARIKELEEKVRYLRAEMIRENEQRSKLEAKVRELEHQCQCSTCYIIPLEWKTLLCGHRFCSDSFLLIQQPVDHVVRILPVISRVTR